VISRYFTYLNGLMWAFSLGIGLIVVQLHVFGAAALRRPGLVLETWMSAHRNGCKAVGARSGTVELPGIRVFHYSSINLFAHRCSLVSQ